MSCIDLSRDLYFEVSKINKHGVENARITKIADRQKNRKFISVTEEKKGETLPPDNLNVLPRRQKMKKLTLIWVGSSPSSICHAKA